MRTAAFSSQIDGVSANGALGGTLGGGAGGEGGGFAAGEPGVSGTTGCGGGGGAGSNYTDPSVTGVVVSQTSLPAATNGSVVIDPQ